MGVHGLTTFLRENRRVLSKTQTFTNSFRTETEKRTPLVVDGWSLIYALSADSGLPWVYGGEYDSFAKFVQDIGRSWLSVGLEPYFVFDGPTPLAKIPTTLKRLTDTNIHNANIFFRTSAAARATPSFLSSTRIIPPLLLEACLDSLRELQQDGAQVHILMADSEADPFCVALAAALSGGLVVGMDSDFVVLCTEGYGGYVPIDEMLWQANGGDDATPMPIDEGLDGFQAVVTKPRTRRKTSGLVPPCSTLQQDLTLVLTIYHPQTLASHLKLQPGLLPLFSALVGNDFSNPANTRKFFESRSNVVERVWKVARAVSAASLSGINKAQERGDTVLDVIHAAVMKLLVRPDMVASGEVDKIVDETVDAALECTIPPADPDFLVLPQSRTCALHPAEECSLALTLGGSSSALLQAYRAGRISSRLLGAVTTGIILPKPFLEDPDQRSCAGVSKDIWNQVWAVLAAGGHIPVFSEEQPDRATADVKSPLADIKSPLDTDSRLDDSELISVVEDFTATEPSVCSDPSGLASELTERLRGLAGSWDDIVFSEDRTEGSMGGDSKRSLVHYTRRGLKLVPEPVIVGQLREMADGALVGPPEIWPRTDKIRLFLEGMKSYTPTLRDAFETKFTAASPSHSASAPNEPKSVDIGTLIWICVLRCVIQASADPNASGNGNAAIVGKWKRAEARAFLASLNTSPSQDTATLPSLDVRTIQRVAQLLYAFDAGARLAEVVYLFEDSTGEELGKAEGLEDDETEGRAHGKGASNGRDIIGQAVRLFSGRAVHAAATMASHVPVDEHLWALLSEGIEDHVWAREQERTKAKSKSKSNVAGGKGGARSTGRNVGFNVLASLESE